MMDEGFLDFFWDFAGVCFSENLATATFRIIPHEGPSFPKTGLLEGCFAGSPDGQH